MKKLQDKIDKMYKQLEKTDNVNRKRDLKRGIKNAKKKKRKEAIGDTIII